MAILGFKIQSVIRVDDLVVVFNELKLQNASVFNLSAPAETISIEEAVVALRAEMLEHVA